MYVARTLLPPALALLALSAAPSRAQDSKNARTEYYDKLEELRVETEFAALSEEFSAELSELESIAPAYSIDRDVYRFEDPTDYSITLVLDPCRGNDDDCCMDVNTAPEYLVAGGADADSGTYATVTADDEALDTDFSRLLDMPIVIDDACEEDVVEGEIVPYRRVTVENDDGSTSEYLDYADELCLGVRRAVYLSDERPACWDHNGTVVANEACSVAGAEQEPCVALAYGQTAYIVECGGDYKSSDHCGTFVEVHIGYDSPLVDNLTILAEARLPGGFVNGVTTTHLPTTYIGDPTRTLCKGQYEIWWVQRTLYDFVVEARKRFYVAEPECAYDEITDTMAPYAWINGTEESVVS